MEIYNNEKIYSENLLGLLNTTDEILIRRRHLKEKRLRMPSSIACEDLPILVWDDIDLDEDFDLNVIGDCDLVDPWGDDIPMMAVFPRSDGSKSKKGLNKVPTIDCKGHTIRGDFTNHGVVVFDGAKFKNCEFEHHSTAIERATFEFGIFEPEIKIENSDFRSNVHDIYVFGSSSNEEELGVYIKDSTFISETEDFSSHIAYIAGAGKIKIKNSRFEQRTSSDFFASSMSITTLNKDNTVDIDIKDSSFNCLVDCYAAIESYTLGDIKLDDVNIFLNKAFLGIGKYTAFRSVTGDCPLPTIEIKDTKITGTIEEDFVVNSDTKKLKFEDSSFCGTKPASELDPFTFPPGFTLPPGLTIPPFDPSIFSNLDLSDVYSRPFPLGPLREGFDGGKVEIKGQVLCDHVEIDDVNLLDPYSPPTQYCTDSCAEMESRA